MRGMHVSLQHVDAVLLLLLRLVGHVADSSGGHGLCECINI